MSPHAGVGLPEALERAATALAADADVIRPANGDPVRLLEVLDARGAIRVLTWLLDNEPADGGELADAWSEAGEPGIQAVLQVDESERVKAGRKALRKTRHRLRSRGIEVQAPESARTFMTARLGLTYLLRPSLRETYGKALRLLVR